MDSIQNAVYDHVMQKKAKRAARMGENGEVTYSEHSDGTYRPTYGPIRRAIFNYSAARKRLFLRIPALPLHPIKFLPFYLPFPHLLTPSPPHPQ